MAGPDDIVERAGEEIEHRYVAGYALDENGQLDPESFETASETIPAVVSDPSEEDEQRTEGRLSTGSIRLTVRSDEDVRADREGWRDLVVRDGRLYQIVEVRDDEHPITGTRKQTAIADEYGGRDPESDWPQT